MDSDIDCMKEIVLPKYKTVIFINGCFWHGHEDCKYFVIPKTRTKWWIDKIVKTKLSDTYNYAKLTDLESNYYI
jgi:DNA mismatch endonuclease (patch repair protein)